MQNFFQTKLLEKLWYEKNAARFILWPFSLIYQAIFFIRRKYLQIFYRKSFDIPVIVVGNISVGGVGKTPVVIALSNELIKHGYKVGIVSRGYGCKVRDFPYEVKPTDAASLVGDEPLLLTKRTNSPVIIDPNRPRAVEFLLNNHVVDVIISDDGLQHYALSRKLEIAVVDGGRMFGNGCCLPAGPLRERPSRLKKVDFVVVNGDSEVKLPDSYNLELRPGNLIKILDNSQISIERLESPVSAVAGIGNPKRFFALLYGLGLKCKEYYFRDHHIFRLTDFSEIETNIIMTEKDAVKCTDFATEKMYFLQVDAVLNEDFWRDFWRLFKC